MENKKIDITSSLLEKGLDTAKNFLGKLIMPAVEETGLLLRDQVTLLKFKNQVKILNKAKIHCEQNNISPKTISLKLLCPLLEFSGLEEDETLSDKWAILLSNMVDSAQNVENQVFPHLLSQLSKREYEQVETIVKSKLIERSILQEKLNVIHEKVYPEIEPLENRLEDLNNQLIALEDKDLEEKRTVLYEKWDLERKLKELNKDLTPLKHKIDKPAYLDPSKVEEFEIANLIRLGIVKSISRQYAYVESSKLSYDRYDESVSLDDLEIFVEPDQEELVITQLGEMFIDVCTEKSKKIPNFRSSENFK